MAHCEHCGHDFVLEKENPDIFHIHFDKEGAGSPKPRTVNVPSKSTSSAGAVVGILIAILVPLLSILIPLFASMGGSTDSTSKPQKPPVVSASFRTKPKSEIMRSFVGHVFEKNADEVTTEELASFQYLKVSYTKEDDEDGFVFYYSMQNPLTAAQFTPEVYFQPLIPNADEHLHWQDFQCFTGLIELDVQDNQNTIEDDSKVSYERESDACSLGSLTKLQIYKGSYYQTLHEVTFADPSKIQYLRTRLMNERDREVLPQFTNLVILETDYVTENFGYENLGKLINLETLKIERNIGDITWLSSLTNLKHLAFDAYGISDFSVLYGLPGLVSLEIQDANALKEIGFVSSMPKLQSLSVYESEVISLQPLAGKLSLTSLTLSRNDKITDYSPIATLNSLTNLVLYQGNYKVKLPSLAALKHLKEAEIYYHDLEALAQCGEMQKLVVHGPVQGSQLVGMQKLNSLTIRGDLMESEALHSLPALKTLCLILSDEPWDNDSSALFTHPTLENLQLINCTLKLLPEKIGVNTTLKVLGIKDCQYIRDTNQRLEFGTFADTLANFHALEELYIAKAELNTLDFVTSMPNLRVLDISENYANDASPIKELKNLKYLYYGGTPIQNITLVPPQVNVYNSGFAYRIVVADFSGLYAGL